MTKTTASSDKLLPPTKAEKILINKINKSAKWNRDRALKELKEHLQIAVEIELATLPIYLYTYYSIDRTPDGFPATPVSRFADEAGALIMSVAVEEMLHMSLACNILFSLGGEPQLYGKSPWPYPANLPHHEKLGPDCKPMQIPLAPFSLEQMWKFLEIEYPATSDAPPQSDNWDTIGQVYSYVRCIILSKYILDEDFQVGARAWQIQDTNYSPNNIDTVYPTGNFNKNRPVPTPVVGSAARVADFTSHDDSHAGGVALLTVDSCESALLAIQTIDAQGEGYGPSKFDDPSDQELSHYYKFLTLQSKLEGYDPKHEKIPANPKPPKPAQDPITNKNLECFVYNVPTNPEAAQYGQGFKECADVVNGLYQYMLIMTETIFKVGPKFQKVYFNQALHRSMIWILDKVLQAMRTQQATVTCGSLVREVAFAPSFENIDLGTRDQAFSNLKKMCAELDNKYGTAKWYTDSYIKYYIDMIPTLFDVSPYWGGLPQFPANPPAEIGANEVRHACMGLNSCANQGRTRQNDCAGQGYCSTALAYNYANPSQPLVADHTCHVKNNCAGQGGCGLYGTAEEQNNPGGNDCATLGSCATPINAERFSTMGPNQGKGVWSRAREIFEKETYPKLRAKNPNLPETPPSVPHPHLFKYGPIIEWIQDYSGQGMTACGASGMSGAGSCA
ncbi:ferritin-like protein [Thalassospira sp. HJ]|uniref:ferritin-like domain-containing protein n=1 Tax=Thalassospira sp. HJ TaxID=1616823 RepID=UPI0006963F38|nr:ferritin-like protein [Thalassospira sp. HJ]